MSSHTPEAYRTVFLVGNGLDSRDRKSSREFVEPVSAIRIIYYSTLVVHFWGYP